MNEQLLKKLASSYCSDDSPQIDKIPQSGSNRLYFRITFQNRPSIIGVYNDDVRENEAFFSLTETFLSKGIKVPQILAIDQSRCYYLLNDLGDETLYSFLTVHRVGEKLGEEVMQYYRKVLQTLPKIQTATDAIDFSVCYPRHAFDRQSMQWDLNYFKYYFLKLANIPFDEQLLEDDFNTFIDFLLKADNHYFLYRDFQSRNIMLHEREPYFIDYQGGRKGPLQYDIASLLYDGKADIPPEIRKELLEVYLDELQKTVPCDRSDFLLYYDSFVLIRILQALGTYGFRGYYEKKSHFLLSIPYAIRNIRYLLQNGFFPVKVPHLMSVLEKLTLKEELSEMENTDQLTVTVNSFSYKKGIPQDLSVNGGGFVFDCRALPNPGRDKAYRNLTGRDPEVIQYLQEYEEVEKFKEHIFALIDGSVDNYLSRHFTHLMVNFGCTGGQHRSVFFAEAMAKHLAEKYPEVRVKLKHRELTTIN